MRRCEGWTTGSLSGSVGLLSSEDRVVVLPRRLRRLGPGRVGLVDRGTVPGKGLKRGFAVAVRRCRLLLGPGLVPSESVVERFASDLVLLREAEEGWTSDRVVGIAIRGDGGAGEGEPVKSIVSPEVLLFGCW